MDEAQIAAQQRQNMPKPTNDLPVEVTSEPINTDQVTGQFSAPMEPLVGYKLAGLLGQNYEPNDTGQAERLQKIYETAVRKTKSTEYHHIAAYVQEMIGLLGKRDHPERMDSLFQWLRLDEIREKTEKEMNLYVNRGQ